MKKLFLFTLLILLVAFLPFLLLRGNLWFSSDFLYQEIPFILETKRMLVTGAPWWSWNTYLGADFIGSYAFYTLTSPFVWINCLFPSTWVAYSTALTLVHEGWKNTENSVVSAISLYVLVLSFWHCEAMRSFTFSYFRTSGLV